MRLGQGTPRQVVVAGQGGGVGQLGGAQRGERPRVVLPWRGRGLPPPLAEPSERVLHLAELAGRLAAQRARQDQAELVVGVLDRAGVQLRRRRRGAAQVPVECLGQVAGQLDHLAEPGDLLVPTWQKPAGPLHRGGRLDKGSDRGRGERLGHQGGRLGGLEVRRLRAAEQPVQ